MNASLLPASHLPGRLLLTAVTFVCNSRLGRNALAPAISTFVTRKHWTIEQVCERGDLQLLQRVVAHEPANQHPLYRSHVFGQALMHAVKHNNPIELLGCLRTYCPHGYVAKGMAEAARLGKVKIMEWLLANCSNIESTPVYAENAARAGQVHVLQWLKKHLPSECELYLSYSARAAVEGNHVEIVQWLKANVEWSENDRDDESVNLLSVALKMGDLDLLKHLHDDQGLEFLESVQHLGLAASSGNLEILQWLHERDYSATNDTVFYVAVEKGFTDIVEWLNTNRPLQYDYGSALENAAKRGHLDIIQLLLPHAQRYDFAYAMRHAAARGHTQVAQWLLENVREVWLHPERPNEAEDMYAFVYRMALPEAASYGHLNAVQWLVHNLQTFVWSGDRSEQLAVNNAAGNGHEDIVKWLHAHRPAGD